MSVYFYDVELLTLSGDCHQEKTQLLYTIQSSVTLTLGSNFWAIETLLKISNSSAVNTSFFVFEVFIFLF